jgi:hypothetical protein
LIKKEREQRLLAADQELLFDQEGTRSNGGGPISQLGRSSPPAFIREQIAEEEEESRGHDEPSS